MPAELVVPAVVALVPPLELPALCAVPALAVPALAVPALVEPPPLWQVLPAPPAALVEVPGAPALGAPSLEDEEHAEAPSPTLSHSKPSERRRRAPRTMPASP